MQLRWNKWTIVIGVTAVLMLAGGVKFLFDASRMSRDFASWEIATPMKCAVDFSKPGQFEADFQQTCSTSHGEVVALRIQPEILKSTTVTQLLAGLEAKIEIKSASGANTIETANAEVLWQNEMLDRAVPIFSISPFRKGNYKGHVVVTAGAPALAGHAQILEARYLLCGLEALPGQIASVIGIALMIFGTVLGIVAFLLALKRGRSGNTLK